MSTFKQTYNEMIKEKQWARREIIFKTMSLLFVRVSSKTVHVYEESYWCLPKKPLLTLYKTHFKIHYWPKKPNLAVTGYLSTKGKFSLNDIRWHKVVTFSSGTKFLFFKGIKISYRGMPKRPYPKKIVHKTKEYLEELRLRKNALQRLYYHRAQAEKRFETAAVYKKGERSGHWNLISVDASQLPMEDVFKLQNVSQRRYIIDYYGMDAILATLEHRVIDSDTIRGNPYDLVEVEIPFSDWEEPGELVRGLYLRMVNPSTGEIHFEGVPNYHEGFAKSRDEDLRDETILSPTVRAALAWRDGESRYRIPKVLT